MSSRTNDVYLVIGGSGFLGRHVVDALLARGDSVSIFDIVQRYHDVPFYMGDISEEEQVSDALRKVRLCSQIILRTALMRNRAAQHVSSTLRPPYMAWTTPHCTGK